MESIVLKIQNRLPKAKVWIDSNDYSIHVLYSNSQDIQEFFSAMHITFARDISPHAKVIVSNPDELHFKFEINTDALEFLNVLSELKIDADPVKLISDELAMAKENLARELLHLFPNHKIRNIKIIRSTFPKMSLAEAKDLIGRFSLE